MPLKGQLARTMRHQQAAAAVAAQPPAPGDPGRTRSRRPPQCISQTSGPFRKPACYSETCPKVFAIMKSLPGAEGTACRMDQTTCARPAEPGNRLVLEP